MFSFVRLYTCIPFVCYKFFIRMPFLKYIENIEVFYVSAMSTDEQRPTEWMTRQSYEDYVQEDQQLTIEGYPAPVRIYVSAYKKGKWPHRK